MSERCPICGFDPREAVAEGANLAELLTAHRSHQECCTHTSSAKYSGVLADQSRSQQEGNRGRTAETKQWHDAVLKYRDDERQRHAIHERATKPSNPILAKEFARDHWLPEFGERRASSTVQSFLDRSPLK